MRHFTPVALIGASLVALIVLAGFFHADSPKSSQRPAPTLAMEPSPPRMPSPEADFNEVALMQKASADRAPAIRTAAGGLLALANAPGYKRAGDLSLRVQDCTKAEDDLEAKLQEIHGEIVEMLMEGTEGSRTCSLSVVIPADKFRGFVTDLRKMGKIQTERITASKLKPGQAAAGVKETEPDPRELSLVSIRMADEKVAQTVLESRGVLASSFDRGASHFMKGLAVLVEFVGLILPFGLAFLAVAAPIVIGSRIRRARATAAAAH